uniref:Uncharacterized protein n=1 Tax=Graphocephala atropunctata TaxID=36148 RepID=A0A1B6KW38_9HEMI
MALQWTPLRRRGGSGGSTLVRARQNVETLEHQTQANVLLAFKLSMVSGNGVSSHTHTLRPSYKPFRKMADIGVQVDDLSSLGEPTEVTFAEVNTSTEYNTSAEISTAAEINTSSEIAELDNSSSVTSSSHQYHRPLSVESSTSSSSSEATEKRKPLTNQEDVDAIFVQQSAPDEDLSAELALNNNDRTELDGIVLLEKDESNCGLDCVYFTMRCCECTIL